MEQEWFSAAELAAQGLPGMPATRANVLLLAKNREWMRAEFQGTRWREREGRGGGVEFHYSLLGPAEQAMLAMRFSQIAVVDEREAAKSEISREDLWAWFDRQSDAKKDKAREKLMVLEAVQTLRDAGMDKVRAMQMISAQQKVKLSTIYEWRKMIKGRERHDWLAYLMPRHAGRAVGVECPVEAWDVLVADYLRLSEPQFSSCYRRLKAIAVEQGWVIPSEDTLWRRMEKIPVAVRVFKRQGPDALKRLYPAQQRDRSAFHALQAVNADGHKWDVFVKWPGIDAPVRPMMVAFQDLLSGKILAWRLDVSENKASTRLAFGDLVEQFGIPDECLLDNGRAFASKWITGGTPNRFRFKVRDEDPEGILTSLGVKVHWATPYAGQSKPIERAFKDLCSDLAKHPRFEGAYTGNNPLAKPDNYGSKAVPLEDFIAVLVAGIAEHNARPGRRSSVCGGVKSFDEVFNESYVRSPIRKATAEQTRLWLMAAEAITVQRQDGSIWLGGNRFWAAFLHEFRGQKVTVRFDPEALQDDAHVYRMDGVYLGEARCLEAVGFLDGEKARQHARDRKAFMRATKELAKAEQRLSLDDLVAIQPKNVTAPLPETKVVRPIFAGNTALALAAKEIHQTDEDAQDQVLRALDFAHGGRLRIVGAEEEDAAG